MRPSSLGAPGLSPRCFRHAPRGSERNQHNHGAPVTRSLSPPHLTRPRVSPAAQGITIPGLGGGPVTMPTFESNVLFVLRFMVDCKAR